MGSSSGGEVAGIDMPSNYCRIAGKRQKSAIVQKFNSLDNLIAKRQHNANYYDQYFDKVENLSVPSRPEYAVHGMLRYSVQVEDNKVVLENGIQNNMPLGNWFDTPLYPVYEGLSKWKYTEGSCPVAESVCKKIVNLPTDKVLPYKQLDLLFKNSI